MNDDNQHGDKGLRSEKFSTALCIDCEAQITARRAVESRGRCPKCERTFLTVIDADRLAYAIQRQQERRSHA